MPSRSHSSTSRGFLRDLLTFDRLIAGQVLHLVYWAGLGLIILFGFAWVGGAIGISLREGIVRGTLLLIPSVLAGLLVSFVLLIIWRTFCEFCSAIFRISEDLRAIRQSQGIPPADEGRR